MTDRYKDTFRVLMIDQHFPDAPYITFEHFDAADQVRRCAAAHVDSLHVTTKCHWGYSYHPTDVGVVHPALNGRDQVGELVEETLAAGMEAIAYFCIQFENLACRTHPEWRMLLASGRPARMCEIFGEGGTRAFRWDMPCIMTGYRQYCLDHIAEIAAGYEWGGLFLDIFGHGTDLSRAACFCDVCMGRYAELGLDPRSDDPVERTAVARHWMRNWADLLTEIRAVLDANRPGMSISLNAAPFLQPSWSLDQVSWPYNEGGQDPCNSVILRGVGPSPQCGIPAGNDAYDAWPPSLVRIMTSTVLAHGCRTFFFFLQGRLGDGTFEQSKYDFMRVINEETVAKQEFVKDAVPLKAAAVYHSQDSWLEAGSRESCMNHDKSIASVIDAFRDRSIMCEFTPSWRADADRLREFGLIVVPEQRCLGDEDVEAFTQYVESGGNILVTGQTGLLDGEARPRDNFALAELLGVDYVDICHDYDAQDTGGYMRFSDHPFFATLRKTDYIMPGSLLQVRARDAEVIAHAAEPLAVETEDSFIGWRALPAGEKADWPCVTVAQRGKGQAIYCAAPLGQFAQDGVRWPAVLIQGIAEALGVTCGLTFEGPSIAAEATFFRKDDRLIVHVLNQSVRHNRGVVTPLRDCRIRCDAYSPKSARVVYPQEAPLTIDGAVIAVPPVEIHTIVEICI